MPKKTKLTLFDSTADKKTQLINLYHQLGQTFILLK